MDLGRTLVQAAQLKDLAQQQQVRQLAMEDALRARREDAAARAYVASMMPQTAVTGPMSPLAPAADSQAITQTAWRVQPGEQAPALSQQTTSIAAQPGLAQHLDWRKMYQLAGKQGLDIMNAVRSYELGDAATRMQILTKGIDLYGDVLNTVVDQPSLDRAHGALQRVPVLGADVAGLLPKTYDPQDIQRRREQLVPMKDRMKFMLDMSKMGIDTSKLSLDQQKQAFDEWSKTQAVALDRQKYSLDRDKFGLEQQKVGQQVPQYGFGNDLDAAIHARYGDVLQQSGGRPTADMLAQARQDVQQGRVDVSAAQGAEGALRTAAGKRLADIDATGAQWTGMANTLEEVDRILANPAGFYERGLLERGQLRLYEAGLRSHDPKAVNTKELERIGASLIALSYNLGPGMSEGDRRALEKGVGDFGAAKNREEIVASLNSIRRVMKRDAARLNAERQSYERQSTFPAFQPSMGKTYDRSEVQRAVQELNQATGKTYTPEQVEKYWQSLGRRSRE
jgi:hypothetical protein